MHLTLPQINKSPKLTESFTRKDFDSLLDVIDRSYYNKGIKPISDDSYDLLLEIYTKRFPKSPRLKNIGAKVSNIKAESVLPNPMSSLTKAKTVKAISKFLTSYAGPYVVSDKEDGMSLQLCYRNGLPTYLYTRGDGVKGKDISFLIPYLKIPKRVTDKANFDVRLEGIAANSTFAKHFDKKAGGDFTAVRNAAGGIFNVTEKSKKFDAAKKYAKLLTLFAFKILAGSGSKLKPSAQFKKLKSLGFTVVPFKIYEDLDLPKLSGILNKRKSSNDYDIDGLVIEQDTYHKIGKANPKHAVSFKENSVADMVDVVCTGVTWNVSRTVKIIPQVNIEPTKIGGVTVTNFTGHNAFYILHGYLKNSDADKANTKPKPIGKGAILKCVRSGGVIPYIEEVVKPARSASAPDVPFKMDGVHYVATGADEKPEIRKKMITHFFVTIGVEGFKHTTVSKFYDNGYTTLGKFLKLQVEDFESIEGFGARKAQVFLTSLRKALLNLDFIKIADASGYFKGFSREKFTAILNEYPNVMKLDASAKSTYLKIHQIHGFSDKTATVFVKGLPKLQKLVDKYGFALVKPKKIKQTGSSLANFKITFTGVRNQELADKIIAMGGTVQSMKADTNILIIKDDSYSNKKVDKAMDDGIKVYTIDKFISKYKVTL